MAALSVQNLSAGGAYTLAAATGGGDTFTAGSSAGGWSLPVFFIASVGATATTITVDGTAYGPFTSQTVVIPVKGATYGRTIAVTYSQATAVTVGAIQLAPAV